MQTAFYTSIGGREVNEDSVHVEHHKNTCLAAVADGLGGCGGGAVASSIAIETFFSMAYSLDTITSNNIIKIFENANSKIIKQQTPKCSMKSTLACLYINGSSALWAHTGDSRIYYFKDYKLVYKSKDQSVSQMAVDLGQITQDEIRFHEDRNKLLYALGLEENVKIEFSSNTLTEGSFHVFLICTDGFWEYVLENEMEAQLRLADNPTDWLQGMKQHLNQRIDSTNDNHTAAAVFISI